MSNFLLILLCIGLGMLFAQRKLVPDNAHKGINAWLLNIALPAVSFKYLPYIQWNKSLLWPVMVPIIVWLGSWVFITIYSRIAQLDKKTTAVLKLVSGLGNTSFVGFPLIMAWYGEEYLSIGIICDQMSFLIFSTFGLLVAVRAAGSEKVTGTFMVKRLLTFPAFIGCVLALIVPRYVDISHIAPLFDKLATTVAPMALFSIGLQLKFSGWQQDKKAIGASLFYKLLIAPTIVLLLMYIFHAQGKAAQISAFEATMPSLLSASIMAERYNVRPELTNRIIGISIVIGLVTTAIWTLFLNGLA